MEWAKPLWPWPPQQWRWQQAHFPWNLPPAQSANLPWPHTPPLPILLPSRFPPRPTRYSPPYDSIPLWKGGQALLTCLLPRLSSNTDWPFTCMQSRNNDPTAPHLSYLPILLPSCFPSRPIRYTSALLTTYSVIREGVRALVTCLLPRATGNLHCFHMHAMTYTIAPQPLSANPPP